MNFGRSSPALRAAFGCLSPFGRLHRAIPIILSVIMFCENVSRQQIQGGQQVV
jgi:hypothetical protein